MITYLWIALGSALGGMARYACQGWAARLISETFPWGTMVVNVSGSFVIGVFATLTGTEGRWLVSPAARTFFMVGVCGGYTTFSSFAYETFVLFEQGQWGPSVWNLLLTNVLCLAGVMAGATIARSL